MEIAPYSLPQPQLEPIFDSEPPKQRQPQKPQQIPQMEIDINRVMDDIQNFNGAPEEAEVLSNLYIGNKMGTVPNSADYKANVDSYLYQGASDADPVELLNYIKRGFIPEEDKDHTNLVNYEALSRDEQWDKIKGRFETSSNIGVGATAAVYVPGQVRQRFISEKEQDKYIDQHISELRNNSQTYKLSLGQGLSGRAKKMVNKMAIAKEPPNLFEYNSLSDRDKSIIPIYASGRNPKHDVVFYEALTGTVKSTASDIFQSFKKTGESIVRSELGIKDPEEFFLRFNARYGDVVDTGSLTEDQHRNIKNWVIDQLQPTIEDPLSIGEAYTQDTYDRADEIMSELDEYMTVGEEARMQKKLESMTRNVTREVYKTGLAGGAVLSATQMGMDLGAVAALSVGTMGLGGMAYSAGRFYGDYEETLLEAGVDPQKARATAVLTTIPYILVEQSQASKVFGKQFKGAANKIVDDLQIGKIATNAIKNSSNPKISKLATGAKITADYIDNVSAELFEEIGQEVFSEIGKHSAIEGYELEESFNNIIETGKEAFKGLLILGAGGPVMRGIKGGYDGDFVEQDISNTIEETFKPLTLQEEQEIGIGNLREDEYQAAEDKEAYLESEGYGPREREHIIHVQDVKEEALKERFEEIDQAEQSELQAPVEGVESLRAMTQRFEPYADIVEEKDGLRITTDKGFDIAVKFNGDIGGDFGVSDPKVATINLSKKSGLPTFNHEFGHMIRDMGGINDSEWKSVVDIARDSLGREEVAKIVSKNKEGYEARGIPFSKDIENHEIFANALEEWTLTGDVPVDARGTLQKFLDFIKDMLAQYIGTSQSGQKVISDIQSGKILERAPSKAGARKMKGAAKRRDAAQKDAELKKERDFIQSALTEEEANNKELISAIDALSKLQQLPDFVTEELSAKERIDQATGITKPSQELRAEDIVSGDEIIESELPGDFFQSEEEGAGLTGEDLYGFGQTVKSPIVDYLDKRKFAFSKEFQAEVDDLTPTEKRRLSKYKDVEAAVDSDVILDELKENNLLSETDTISELIDRLASADTETKFSMAPRTIKDIKDKWSKDAKVSVSEKDNLITLDKIIIPEDQRGEGVGTKFMEDLTGYADGENKTIALTPSKDFGGSVPRLKKFYKGFGFVENKGKNKDFEISESMYRLPQETKFSMAPREDSEAFKNWFGDSKVVNEDGSPKVVYHGTGAEFTEFSKDFFNKVEDRGDYVGEGFFFTGSQKKAEAYAKQADGGKVMPVYLSLKNPFIPPKDFFSKMSDDQLMDFFDSKPSDIRESLIEQGYDGLIDPNYNQYAVFEPNQIKSATENVGTFDPTNPDIRYSFSPRSERDAAIVLANAIVTGKAKSLAQRDQILNSYKIPLENQAAIKKRAFEIADQVEQELGQVKNTDTIRKAIKDAEIKQFYDAQRKELHEMGIEQGELLAMARERLKATKKQEREAIGQDITTPKQVEHNEYFLHDPEDIDDKLIEIGDDIKRELVKAGVFTKKKKQFDKEVQYKIPYANSLGSILENYIYVKVPAGHKQALLKRARELKKVRRLDTLEKRFKQILSDAQSKQIKISKADLLKKWDKIMNQRMIKERNKSTKELIHSKVKKTEDGIKVKDLEPTVRSELKLIKQIAKLSKLEAGVIRDKMLEFFNDPSDLEGKEIGDIFKVYEDRFSAFKGFNHLEPVDRAAILAKAASTYGGIKEKTPLELNEAIESVNDLISGSQKSLEDLINKKNAKAQPRRDDIAALKGKRRGEIGQKIDRFLASSFGMGSWFKDILRQAPTESAEKAQRHLNEILADWNDSIHARDIAIMEDHEDFGKSIQEIYGAKDAWAIEKELNTKKKEYAHLSKNGDKLSKFQIMQLYASAVQQDYLDNVKKHTHRQAGRHLKYLTKQDLTMIQWFRDYYAKERVELSAQMEKMTGIPIEMLDPFYVPVKVESNQAGLGTEINATAIIPPGMTRRVSHQLDFDESVGMFEIWARKVEENNHFKYTADTAVEMRSVFSTKPVHEALEFNYGKPYKNAFLTMIKDNINNGGPSTYDIKALDTIRGTWTAMKFALNARIGIKQLTSIPAFGLEIGLIDTGKHVASFFTPDGIQAVKEIWNSDLRKERWGSGNTEAINNAIGGMGSHTTVSKWFRRSMVFNNLGDMGPTLMIGQGMYRSYTDTFYSQGPQTPQGMKEAKEKALSRTFQMVESTQQSSKLKDMAEWQRRGGSLGKMAAQFTNTTRQFLEKDFTDVRAFLADPKNIKKQKKAANTLFINHFLLPGAYNGMNMIINKLMGDDIEEEDWWLMFASMISGPMSGFIVFGSVVTGAIESGVTGRAPWGNKSLTPFAGIKDDINNAVLMTEGVLTTDWDQFDKAFTKLMKSLIAPYREYEKINKNNQ